MTESQKRKINKASGPKKVVLTVKESEHEVLDSVPAVHWKSLGKLIQECRDVFHENRPKGAPPNREVQQRIEIEPVSESPYGPPYRLGPGAQDELEKQIKSPGSGSHSSVVLSARGNNPICAQEGWPVVNVHRLQGIE